MPTAGKYRERVERFTKAARGAQVRDVEPTVETLRTSVERLKLYERKYRMSTEQARTAIDERRLDETMDVCQWLMLDARIGMMLEHAEKMLKDGGKK